MYMNSNISESTNQMLGTINNGIFQNKLLNKMSEPTKMMYNINNTMDNGYQSIVDKLGQQRVSMEKIEQSNKKVNNILKTLGYLTNRNKVIEYEYPCTRINEA